MRDWEWAKSAACHAAPQTCMTISFWERERALSLALLLARVRVKATGEGSAGMHWASASLDKKLNPSVHSHVCEVQLT